MSLKLTETFVSGNQTGTPTVAGSGTYGPMRLSVARRVLIEVDTFASITDTAPPAAPAEGVSYFLPAGVTGAWAGQAGMIAHFAEGGWEFLAPNVGHAYGNSATGDIYSFDGTNMVVVGGGGGGGVSTPTTVVTDSTLTGNGTTATPLGLADFPDASAADIAAISGTTKMVIRNGAGDLVIVTRDDLGLSGATPTTPIGPFSAGQNAADWVFRFPNGDFTLPAGPAGVPGYWQFTFDVTQATVTITNGGVFSGVVENGAIGIAPAGATVSSSPSDPSGGISSSRGWWVAI